MNISHKIERRFPWIEASLRFTGRFGVAEKKAYRDRFGLTDGMVSRDQDAFLQLVNERCGLGCVIKKRGRLSLTNATTLPAKPVFKPLPKMADWLGDALGPRFEIVPQIRRAEPTEAILRSIVQAILGERPLQFRYQPRRGQAAIRRMSPHAIVHVVGRLHVRGWDHDRNAPRDFVLTRIVQVLQSDGTQGYVTQKYDHEWHEQVVLEVRLRDGENPEAVRLDYDLGASNCGARKVRKSHAGYLIDDSMLVRKHWLRAPVSVKVKGSE